MTASSSPRPFHSPTEPDVLGPMVALPPLGRRLQDVRRAAGLSQQELAVRADVSIAAITTVEQGRRYPSPDMIGRLVEAIGTDDAYLLAEYRLSRARELLDEREVGLDQALSCLDAFDAAQQRLAEERMAREAQPTPPTSGRDQATGSA